MVRLNWCGRSLSLLLSLMLLWSCRRGGVIATVNGKPITKDEFWRVLESRHGVTTLITLIDRKLLSQANRKMRLVDEFYVSNEVVKRIEQLGGEAAFRDWLRKTNMSEKLFRDEIRAGLVLDALRSLEASKQKPTEKELIAFLDAVKKRFGKVRWAKIRVIETLSEEDAQSLYEQVIGGASFTELASKFNVRGELRQKAGELGALPLDKTVIEDRLIEAIKGLKVGQVCKPIEVGGLWVIVKLEAILNVNQLSLKLARSFVEAEYRKAVSPSHAEVLQKLRDDADVRVHVEAYKAVEGIYGHSLKTKGRQGSSVGGK